MSYRPALFIIALGVVLWVVVLRVPVQAETTSLLSSSQSSEMRCWFGTSDGVSLLEGQQWTTYPTPHGLASNTVRAIVVNLTGEKWFTMAKF